MTISIMPLRTDGRYQADIFTGSEYTETRCTTLPEIFVYAAMNGARVVFTNRPKH